MPSRIISAVLEIPSAYTVDVQGEAVEVSDANKEPIDDFEHGPVKHYSTQTIYSRNKVTLHDVRRKVSHFSYNFCSFFFFLGLERRRRGDGAGSLRLGLHFQRCRRICQFCHRFKGRRLLQTSDSGKYFKLWNWIITFNFSSRISPKRINVRVEQSLWSTSLSVNLRNKAVKLILWGFIWNIFESFRCSNYFGVSFISFMSSLLAFLYL